MLFKTTKLKRNIKNTIFHFSEWSQIFHHYAVRKLLLRIPSQIMHSLKYESVHIVSTSIACLVCVYRMTTIWNGININDCIISTATDINIRDGINVSSYKYFFVDFKNVIIVFANRKVGWLRHIFIIHYFFKSSYPFN